MLFVAPIFLNFVVNLIQSKFYSCYPTFLGNYLFILVKKAFFEKAVSLFFFELLVE
ncbi:hypothetical protein HNQ88_003464 [Aureibacter tunicatorum]|uniref:Uncharacterized protein n=1 Tax=Aureibacter tunicatorum TaxID=866807 RepID=A0AAE3XQX0_9BACT|nr:hypothetical protein [Aureibacter tunicatorum]BDD05722.1 hypothetical protein AUTU_32050 [Aureibacter tunicatorum]